MARKQILHTLFFCMIAWAACTLLAASEHHGVVKFSGLPVPGATITVSQGDKKLTAVTDSQGAYTFPDLADGTWTIQVEMLCFTTLKQEVAIAPNAPSPEWELKLMPLDEIKAEIKAAAPPPAPSTPGPASTPATTATAAAAAPAAAPTPAPASTKKGSKKAAAPAANSNAGFQRADLNVSGAPPAEDTGAPGIDEASPGAADALMVNGA